MKADFAKIVVLRDSLTKVKEWWRQLNTRERQITAVGGVLLVLFIIYQFIWSPLINGAHNVRERLTASEKTLSWMQMADQEIKAKTKTDGPKENTLTPVSFVGFLQKQIAEASLSQQVSALKQISNESVELHFQKVEFDKLIQLLIDIQTKERVTISQMSATSDKTTGMVSSDIILQIR